jgi:hypothetical protein
MVKNGIMQAMADNHPRRYRPQPILLSLWPAHRLAYWLQPIKPPQARNCPLDETETDPDCEGLRLWLAGRGSRIIIPNRKNRKNLLLSIPLLINAATSLNTHSAVSPTVAVWPHARQA